MHRVTSIFAALTLSISSMVVAQTQIEVSLTTDGPVGLAPAFAAFHDGSYDIFDVGSLASPGLELLAELGDASILLATAPAGVNAQSFAAGGPFLPSGGNTGSAQFSVDGSQTSFSMAAMILPSNDYFIGNSSAFDISSLLGASAGTQLTFSFLQGYDAGTEADDFAFGPGGGLVGITTPADPPGGTVTMDPISVITGPDPFASFANLEPANFDTSTIDFTGASIATVTLTVVPEPASLGLAGAAALALLGYGRRR